jgi:GAF domain-containing protein
LIQSSGENKEIRETLHHIASTAQTVLDADACVIFPINPITGRFFESLTVSSNYVLQEDELSAECLRSAKLVQAILKQGSLIVANLQQAHWQEEEPVAVMTQLSDVYAVVALALHIKQSHKPLGVLYLLYKTEKLIIKNHELFTICANYVSFILQGDWLQYRYQEVAHIGQEINHDLSDVVTLFQKLQKNIGRILDANYALILFVYQPQAQTLDIYQTEEGHSVQEINTPFEGASRYVIESKQTVFIRDINKEALYLPFQIVRVKGTNPQESFIYVPLLLGEQPLGVLSIQHPQANAYNDTDLFILKLLANHVALALYNTRLYSSLNQLNETGQILTQQFDSERALQTIVDNIKEAMSANIVILYPYHQVLQRIQPPCVAGTLLTPESQQTMYPTRSEGVVIAALRFTEAIFAQKSVDLYFWLQGRLPQSTESFYQREKISSTAVIPLRIDNRIVGVLFVNFRQPQSFDKPQKLLIEGLAHYASIALKSNQAFGTLSERHLRELLILQKIDQALNDNNNLEIRPLLHTILKLAHEHIPVTGQSSILLYNAHKRYFTQGALTGSRYEERVTDDFIPVTQKGIISWVVKYKKPARVDDVHHDLPWYNIYVQATADTVSELDVPLIDGDEVVGILNFESSRKAAFRPEDEQFLVTLAGQAVLTIKKAQAYEREKRFADRFRLLYKAGSELASITNLSQIEQAYRTITDIAQELSKSPVVIRRYDEESQVLHMTYASWYRYSPPSQYISLHEGFNGRVAREQKTWVIDDIYELSAEYPRPTDPTIRSLIIAPIIFKDQYYGNLELSHEGVAHFRDKDKEFFEGLAQQLASTLYRLEITRERQELGQRAQAAEVMIAAAQSTYEITHRLGNDLGLVEFWVSTIQEELKNLNVNNTLILGTLSYIKDAVNKVMHLSESLRTELQNDNDKERFVLISPRILLENTQDSVSLPANIQVTLEIEEHVALVWVIHQLIVDALRNFVTNAKEAMPEGGLLTLRARNIGRSVALEVIDTGVGISTEHQLKIFDLFFSTKRSSGFGLWSARRNVLKNRGTLEVKSEPTRGTTFTLLLPKAEEDFV